MTEPAAAFERYKDALKRGHVAALRHRLADALTAYEDAALLAPDRALPLTSRGTVLARMGRHEDALVSFDQALERAPRDEAALAGRAEALAALGQRGEAATAFDIVVDIHERAGRLSAASEAARKALDLVESRHRRARLRELADRLAPAPGDEAAALELERAHAMLEVAGAPPSPDGPVSDASVVASGDAPAPEAPSGPPAEAEEPPPVEIAALARRADDALDLGDTASAREALLELAQAHREAGRIDAGLDAGYLALSIAPGNVDLHLELVALYLERGWRAPAAEKVRLLTKLVDLADDPAAIRRLEATVAERFPDVGAGAPPSG